MTYTYKNGSCALRVDRYVRPVRGLMLASRIDVVSDVIAGPGSC